MSDEEYGEPAPRPEERSKNSSGKRTAAPGDDDNTSSQQGSSSKRHNSSESISSSVLQSTLATAISTIMAHNIGSNSAMQMEWKRAEEAVAECRRLEAVVRETGKLKVMM
jgi:hypothetical protein